MLLLQLKLRAAQTKNQLQLLKNLTQILKQLIHMEKQLNFVAKDKTMTLAVLLMDIAGTQTQHG